MGLPPWAPAYGYRAHVHRYYYYPAADVYYSLASSSYFYLSGGAWQVGISLPSSVFIDPGAYVSLDLDTDRPYLYYEEHRNKYRGGKRRDHDYERGYEYGREHEDGPGHGRGHGHGRWR